MLKRSREQQDTINRLMRMMAKNRFDYDMNQYKEGQQFLEEISSLNLNKFVDYVDGKDQEVLDGEMEQYEAKVAERQKQLEEEKRKKDEEENQKKENEQKKKQEDIKRLRAAIRLNRI